jgi:thiol-disulfide isomerase/thioredoxin
MSRRTASRAAALLAGCLLALSAIGAAPAINPHTGEPDPDSGAELIGTPAPRWAFDRWVRGGPLALDQLRGKVVLVRWWTEGCRFCESTLPAIERLRREHPDDLVVVGVFHPKPPHAVSDRHILEVAGELGFDGPVAFDGHWKTLGRYWLDGHPDRNWTSVSFLIDRSGVIRWVHGGGEYHPSDDPRHARCDAQYRDLEAALGEALAAAKPSAAKAAKLSPGL